MSDRTKIGNEDFNPRFGDDEHGRNDNRVENDHNQFDNHRENNLHLDEDEGRVHDRNGKDNRENTERPTINLRIGNRNDNENNGNHYGHDREGFRNDHDGNRGRGNARVAEVVNLGDLWRETLGVQNNHRNNPNTVTNHNFPDNYGNQTNINNQNVNANPINNNQNPNINPVATNQTQNIIQSQIPAYQTNNQYNRSFYNPPQNFSHTNFPANTTNNNPAVNAPVFNQSSNPVSWNNINNPNTVTLPQNDHNDAGFRTTPSLLSSVANFLSGLTDGSDLAPEMRQVLSTASTVLGNDFVNRLDPNINAQQPANLLVRTLENVNTQFNNPGLHLGNFNNMQRDPNAAIQVAVEDLVSAYQLSKYFGQMESGVGNLVRQAETVLTNFLFGIKGATENTLLNNGTNNILQNIISDKLFKGFTPEQIMEYLSVSKIFRDISPAEVLRDLRSGSFVSPYETFNPFPLTGRARIASEMIELLHTLDMIEEFAQYLAQQRARMGQPAPANAETIKLLERFFAGMNMSDEFLALLKATLANEKMFTMEEFMRLFQIALPGRAARSIIPEIVLALNCMLPNMDGRMLVAKDGTPLMLDKLVWFNLAGGLVSNISSMFDSFQTRLSPLLLYGFDAIYSLTGFDGRTLAHQHFAAVQANINDTEPEWIFGQEPFTLGWMREMIERLKDSHVIDHNLLGEQLEEAMAHGCFHTLLVNVSVERGSVETENIRVTRFTPGFAGDFAFNASAVN